MGSDLVERKLLACAMCAGIGSILGVGPCTYCNGNGYVGVALSLGDPKDARIAELEAALSAEKTKVAAVLHEKGET